MTCCDSMIQRSTTQGGEGWGETVFYYVIVEAYDLGYCTHRDTRAYFRCVHSHFEKSRNGPYFFRWGWILLERTRILSGIQFTRHYIEFVVVETKYLVGSNVNVILT